MDRLIVGLGNPGAEHERTRHNIGQDLFESLSFYSELRFQNKFKGRYSVYNSEFGKVYFLIPETYMNLSGESVAPLMKFFKISLENILIIHDELDFPLGTISFKDGGGLAGHNGLKSITSCLGSQSFARLRIGIGRPVHGSVSSWVLSRFSDDEKISMEQYLSETGKLLETYINKGIEKIPRPYNKRKILGE